MRKDPDAESESETDDQSLAGYDCYLCDYEGQCHYKEDEKDELDKGYEHCGECVDALESCSASYGPCTRQWDDMWISTCMRCGKQGNVYNSPLCKYHKAMTEPCLVIIPFM
jgi:hypothetical protein